MAGGSAQDAMLVLEGGCACGAIRFRARGPVHSHVICHCESCRRATGALQVPWFTVARENFSIHRGRPMRRESSPGTWRSHCAGCGTTLTYESPGEVQPAPEIDVTTTSLDDPTVLAPDAHIWTGDDHGWMAATDRLPRYVIWRSEGMLDTGGALRRDISLRLVPWASARDALMSVRTKVFVEEQGVPASLEEDDRDPSCLHLLATRDGKPVGAARLDIAQHGKLGRVAVLRALRGQGLGQSMMRALQAIAPMHGLQELWCHAQLSAVPFYERLGYRREGEEFLEAGIAHVVLRRRLDG
jgi:predicted GNAT family N-acyltransferase